LENRFFELYCRSEAIFRESDKKLSAEPVSAVLTRDYPRGNTGRKNANGQNLSVDAA